MPGSSLNLVPPEALRPNQIAEPSSSVPVPQNALPKFGPPALLMPDNFWSNLKQFLFERPVKIRGNYRSPLMPQEYGGGMGDNFKEFFRSAPTPKGPIISRLTVNWNAGFGGFGDRIKELFFPKKQPPLMVTSKPVKVKDIWSKDENFGWTQITSFLAHGAIAALIIMIPLLFNRATAVQATANVTPLDISPYMMKLPAGNDKAGGGGGGGDRTPTPPTKGRAPKFKWDQFTPPTAVIKNPKPKLPMDPSLLGPPDLRVSSPALTNMGDPLAAAVTMSNGPGGGGGLGTGEGGGIGSGTGGGLGPGEGGGTGGGVFRAGLNGVGMPTCFYAPDPQYSDEARKAKYQGIVVLQGVITLDGRVTNISVMKSPGLGLDEKAVEAVRTWRCKPAMGPNGKPVPTLVPIEVTFRLF
ncbi:MAG TPA: energy transducer TonB [Terriglobales bacterium]|nr:energy transducer TonB [Terriglobales bacterium]